ncbi:MAG: hypothetical protein HYS08_08935 [Chlamydiae bacterium]|nr:hypothetical protein [Chlamydiota bacterium]MBI3265486.1 hypothetical protein [Chlamydiota bacterium]
MNQNNLKKILKRLKEKQASYLSPLPNEALIQKLHQVTLLWLDTKSPTRREAETILSESTGCSRKVISEGLNIAFREVQSHHLKTALQKKHVFSNPKLSSFIFAGIIPTPMLFDIFWALLLKSSVFVKCSSRAPFFPMLLAESIRQVDPKLGNCISCCGWKGGEFNFEKTIFKASDLIHVYGNDETLLEIQKRLPSRKKFLPFGHKVSIAVIDKESLRSQNAKKLARRAAYDICLYDQQGCVSPHAIYVEKESKISAREWAKILAEAMKEISHLFPPGKISAGEASQIHQIRGRYQFKKKAFSLSSHPNTSWTVLYENDSAFHPSCLNRTIFVKPLGGLGSLVSVLKGWENALQAIGYSIHPKNKKRFQDMARKTGAVFLRPLGQMQALTFEEHIRERIELMQLKK